MSLKKYISFFTAGLIGFCLHAQNTHQLIGSAGYINNGLGLSNGIDNISWTVGEVIVFNDAAADGALPHPRFTLSQSMQSYPPYVPVDNCAKVSVSGNSVNLCDIVGFNTSLSYSSSFDLTSEVLDSVQWLFSGTNGDPKIFAKIQGATVLTSKTYQPFFPGFYAVSLKYVGSTCKSYSTPVEVKTLSSSFSPPQIVPTGSPANVLSAYTSKGPNNSDPTLQWYVYVTSLNKYLMIAGGSNASQKVRYDGTYMVIATYPGGCRLSNTFDVTGYGQSIQRATDVRMDANTIYIPDEIAPDNASLSVYPNPTMGAFIVKFQSSDEITTNAELYSNTGIFVKEIIFSEGSSWSRSAKVSTDDLSAGVYFLKVNQEAKHFVQKVVIYK